MEEDYKCPKCGGKPKYVGGDAKEFIFYCSKCDEEFRVEDKGFGYLPMRVRILKELYP